MGGFRWKGRKYEHMEQGDCRISYLGRYAERIAFLNVYMGDNYECE